MSDGHRYAFDVSTLKELAKQKILDNKKTINEIACE